MNSRLYVSIALGGMSGAVARYLAGEWVSRWAGEGFPWGTLLINVSGSLLLGFLVRVLPAHRASDELRAALTIGLCGGFTTFSAFAFEAGALLVAGRTVTAAIYATATILLGVAAAGVGYRIGGAVWRAHA